jgi:Double zinc ribbon
MVCSKCQHENPETARFCLRCHTPLRFICPACHHEQQHGGQCDKCGTDFLKYAMMLEFRMKSQAEKDRQKLRTRAGILKQILLLPITGGFSLLKYVSSRLRGE